MEVIALPRDADECGAVGEHHALPIVLTLMLLLTPIEFRVLDYEGSREAATSSNGVDDLALVDDAFIHGSDDIHRHVLMVVIMADPLLPNFRSTLS